MDPATLVWFWNLAVLPGWAMLVLLPRWRLTRELIPAVILPLLLAMIYLYLAAVYFGAAKGDFAGRSLAALPILRGSVRSPALLTSLKQSLKYKSMPSANTSSAQLDNVFRALGDPTRQAIIERLADSPASVSELAAPFDMSLPAIYQHLQILRDAGLVQTIKAGRIRTCRLEVRVLRRAEDWLSERRAMWEHRLDALAEHLARDKMNPGGKRSQ